jgi:hypothetical protein
MKPQNLTEFSLPTDTNRRILLPTNEKFGTFFAVFFGVCGIISVTQSWAVSWIIGLGSISVAFATATVLRPTLLTTLNRIWFNLGLLLGKIVSPIVLGVIFFLLLTPIALLTRLFGRDELLLKPRSSSSYWLDRDNSAAHSSSYKNQY